MEGRAARRKPAVCAFPRRAYAAPLACSIVSQALGDAMIDPVSWLILLGTLAALVSMLNSISPLTSWQGGHENVMGFLTTLALSTVFFATRAIVRDSSEARPIIVAVTLALVPVSLYALIQVVGLDPFVWAENSPFAGWTRPIGTLGHPNYLAGYSVMALPLAFWYVRLTVREGRHITSRLLTLLVILGCVVVVTSLSRAAWLAAGCVVLLFLMIQARRVWAAWFGGDSLSRIASRRPRRVWLIVATGAVLVAGTLGVAAKYLPLPFRERLRQVTTMDARAGRSGRAPGESSLLIP